MDSMHAKKVARFRERIGLDAALRDESLVESAQVQWPDMLGAPGIDRGSWRVAADTLWRDGGGEAREWVLRRGRETMSMLAFVSSTGPEPARSFLLRRASENMMIEVPFVRGPSELGSLAVTGEPAGPPFFLWVFRNLCLEVKARETRVDALAVARWLQALASRSLVPQAEIARRPAPAVDVALRRPVVGQVVDIALELPTDPAGTRYVLQVEVEPGRMRAISQQGGAVQVMALLPGRATVQLHVVDSHTLIATRSTVELDVTAQPARP